MSLKFNIIYFLSVVLLFAGYLLFNTLKFTPLPPRYARPVRSHEHSYKSLTPKQLAERLSQALQIPTISYQNSNDVDVAMFIKFHDLLRTTFPKVHDYLQLTVINKYSLLYKWEGQDKTLKPYLLMGHYDVVPADDADQWTHNPFGGVIAGGFLWGRGAIDNKHQVFGILEAVEELLLQGYTPSRTIYIAFGHDEEVSGFQGAKHTADYFQKQGITFEFVLDEGMFIYSSELIPGFKRNIACVGTAEKGRLDLELFVEGTAGHSSFPPAHTAIGQLAAAIVRLENSPHPSRFEDILPLLETVGREIPDFFGRFILANSWLFKPIIVKYLDSNPILRALFRTTTAVTLIHGGIKSNVLPANASAVVNHRISVSQTIDEVEAFDVSAIADPQVRVTRLVETPPSPVSNTDSFGYKLLAYTVRQLHEDAIVVPAVLIASTDTRHFWNLTENIFRFAPVVLSTAEASRLHGRDERISVENYAGMVDYFYHLIRNSDMPANSMV